MGARAPSWGTGARLPTAVSLVEKCVAMRVHANRVIGLVSDKSPSRLAKKVYKKPLLAKFGKFPFVARKALVDFRG